MDASDEQWLAYEKEHGKVALWLQTAGLTRADLYDFVFEGNEASGLNVADIQDREGIKRIDLTQSRETAHSDDDNSNDIFEAALDLTTPSLSRLHLKRQLSNTPDSQVNRRSKKRSTLRLAQDIGNSLASLVTSLQNHTANIAAIRQGGQREVGAVDIITAVADARSRFGLSGARLFRFSAAIAKPLQAVIWNSIEEDNQAKREFLITLVRVDNDEFDT